MRNATTRAGLYAGRGRASGARAFSPFVALAAAFALFLQLLAASAHQARWENDSVASVAEDLKATFGDSAVLCVHVGDDGAPASPERRSGHCDENCPLCRISAQSALLLPPAPSLPARLDVGAALLRAPLDVGRERIRALRLAQARAPPFAI